MLKSLRVLERYLWHMVAAFATVTIIFLMIKFFVLNVGVVNGISMEPTFIDNDRFLINKIQYLVATPKRYDTVQVIDPKENILLIKRVIALPGEEVVIRRGKVFIKTADSTTSTQIDEAYLRAGTYTRVLGKTGPQQYTLSDDEYFIIGDNRNNSIDSRVYGPVHRSRLVGKVIRKL